MSLGLRYWKAVAIALAPFVVYLFPRESFFDHSHTLCLFHLLTGRDCWGCGMMRALVSLMYLDFGAAWKFNRVVVVVAPLLVWLWIRWIISEVRRARVRVPMNKR